MRIAPDRITREPTGSRTSCSGSYPLSVLRLLTALKVPAVYRPTLPALSLEAAEDAAAQYARGSRAASTWRAYESDWRIFAAWCQSVKPPPLPASPHTVALFLAAQARLGHAPSTLDRRRAAIRLMHVGAKIPSPHDALEVDEVLRHLARLETAAVAESSRD